MKKVRFEALGAYINELLKRAKLKNECVYQALNIGHSTLNDLKKG